MAGKAVLPARRLAGRIASGAMTWRDRWRDLRNKLLIDPRFQSRAVAFALTRPIARRHARQVFDLCAGFVYSQVLSACVQLKLLETLRDGPASAANLGRSWGMSAEAAERLLRAAATLRLVERRGDGRFGLGIHGAALLGNAGAIAMIEHHGAFYADMADPVALLRGEKEETNLSRYWPYAGRRKAPGDAEVAAYSQLMASSQQLVAKDILDAYPFQGHSTLLDVGGGNGQFLYSAAQHVPHLQLMLFDLPAVSRLAESRLRSANLLARAKICAGDFRIDEIPKGADIITLVRVIHDHDDDVVRNLLRKIHDALPRNGCVVIAEPLAETTGAEAVGDVYFAFYLLAMGSGRARTAGEIGEFLRGAGFSNIRRYSTRLPLQVSVIAAARA